MQQPRVWSDGELAGDAALACRDFRQRRLGEPLARYLAEFDKALPEVSAWIRRARSLMQAAGAHSLQDRLGTERSLTALRYLAAPPISEDDLETLAEVPRLTGRLDMAKLESIRAVMAAILDPRRFPWLADGREPEPAEFDAAVLSTTVLLASQRIQTLRRGDERSAVEGAVKGLLIGMGWSAGVAHGLRGVQSLADDAPPRRTFFVGTNLGEHNADVLVRLDDGRLLAIECKGSNSEINSRKRVNKEAVQNARAWLDQFGSRQVVVAVALQGVFHPRYLEDAQRTPLAVFWGHRLSDVKDFLAAAR